MNRIKSLLIFFGPILLPKAIGYYRRARAAPRVHGLAIRPIPAGAWRAIVILAAVSLAFLAKTLPAFSPENVFRVTQSRLQIPTDVLFTRLAALRPNRTLTAADEALRARFVNQESRLLYLQFGPDALAWCPFCTSDDPRSYLYYALPAQLAPHLVNLVVLAAATSSLLAGRESAAWRTTSTIAAGAAALADVYLTSTYAYQANSRALRLADLHFFYWDARRYRAWGLAALDLAIAALLYLSSTNRLFASPPSPAERVELVARGLASTKSKLNALGIVKNTALRDDDLRARGAAYWATEVRLMREVMEEREVIEGVNDALTNRIDISTISRDADKYAEAMLMPLQMQQEELQQQQQKKRDATPTGPG